MKLAYIEKNRTRSVALVSEDGNTYWSVDQLANGFSGDMVDLIRNFDEVKNLLVQNGPGLSIDGAKVLAPITAPRRNIFCVGKNYHEHAAEFQKSGFDSSAINGEHAPEAPVVFSKPASTVIGNGDVIPSHKAVTSQLDYEAELGVIIGKGGKGITKENAMEHVFGYTNINDMTARDLQKLHRQWFLGKSLDGFCPMGPWIVTADSVDGENLNIQCWVNGELRQNSNTSLLIFDIPTLIETISAGIELQPGDIIATGTPAGVGIGFSPARFLQTGDTVKVAIEHLGALENVIGE